MPGVTPRGQSHICVLLGEIGACGGSEAAHHSQDHSEGQQQHPAHKRAANAEDLRVPVGRIPHLDGGDEERNRQCYAAKEREDPAEPEVAAESRKVARKNHTQANPVRA